MRCVIPLMLLLHALCEIGAVGPATTFPGEPAKPRAVRPPVEPDSGAPYTAQRDDAMDRAPAKVRVPTPAGSSVAAEWPDDAGYTGQSQDAPDRAPAKMRVMAPAGSAESRTTPHAGRGEGRGRSRRPSWPTTGQIPASSATVYVNVGGSDSVGDGSVTNPYLTVSYALSTIADASSDKHYSVLMGPGRYTEASLNLKPWVYVIGQAYEASYLAVSSGSIGLDPAFADGGNRAGLVNLYLNGGTGLNWDLAAIGGEPTPSAVLLLDLVWVEGSVVVGGRPQGIDFLEAYDCFLFANVALDSMLVQMQGMQFEAALALTDSLAACDGAMSASVVEGQLQATSSGAGVVWQVSTTPAYGGWNVTGAGAQISADAVSWPPVAIMSVDPASAASRANDAGALGYTPANPSDWAAPAPATVQEALDRLAALP
jgi:hypothetical protein